MFIQQIIIQPSSSNKSSVIASVWVPKVMYSSLVIHKARPGSSTFKIFSVKLTSKEFSFNLLNKKLPYGIGSGAAYAPKAVFQAWFPVGSFLTFMIGECSGKSSRRSRENRLSNPRKSVFPPKD